jgi:replicative DNA helicase
MFKKITNSHLKLKEFPTSMASIFDIEAHLDSLKTFEEFEPDILIIDYGDIMKSTRNTKSTYEEQGWIFRELRGLAIKRNLVIITATQTTRDSLTSDGGTAEVIGMDKAADSMEKNRILDVLFSITQSRQEKDDGAINLWVAKNRNGKSSTFLEFLINYKNFQIKEQNALMGGKGGKGNGDDEDAEPNTLTKQLANELSMDLKEDSK